MRELFVNWLIKKAEKDKKIVLLYIDLGFSFLEPFIKKFPNRAINTGCIEQSAIGIAGGLASESFKPYVYSASTFLLFRAYEQIRNDLAYQNLNVKLIGYTGEKGNFLGHTHHIQNQEDKNVLLDLPNMENFYPENKEQLLEALNKSYRTKKPSYIRLDKENHSKS